MAEEKTLRLRQSTDGRAALVHLDKEEGDGRWLLSFQQDNLTVLRLRVSVGGPWDWHSFTAEVQARGEYPSVLGEFDIAPAELLPGSGEPSWNPEDEDEREFQRLPQCYREVFAAMVRQWGRVIGFVLPAPAWRTLH